MWPKLAIAEGRHPFAIFLLSGLIVGGVIGYLIIRPVNNGLGWFFREFNKYFDKVTAIYGSIVAKTCAWLRQLGIWRSSADLLAIPANPRGFIPQQDKGYLILNVQMPTRRRSSEPSERWRSSKRSRAG